MALNFPDPATQTPVNTFSPSSTPSASTNGITYLWDGQKWNAQTNGDAAFWQRVGTTLSPVTAGDNISTTGDISSADVTASSEVKAPSLLNAATTGDPNITLNADGSTLIRDLQNTSPNLVINGAMTVSQRFTSNTGQTATAYRACDRFQTGISTLGTWTVSQAASAPAGLSKSLRMECTTADASPAAGAFVAIFYTIEAQDLQLLNYGTANAEVAQLSFWVRSNKTGSASFAIRQRDNSDKLFSKAYNFNGTANTWKKVEIEIPADTAGVINNDNGQGLTLAWWLNSGSTFTGGGATAGWEALNNTKRNPTNAGIGGTVGDYFEVTGVQLTATDAPIEFQHEDYATTLAKCQRYFFKASNKYAYWRGDIQNGKSYGLSAQFPTEMRTAPTVNNISTDNVNAMGSVALLGSASTQSALFTATATTTGSNGQISAGFDADAEL